MFKYGNDFGSRTMMQFATAYQTMALSSAEVILRRSLMLASGSMSASDATTMVVEKASTFAEAAERASYAVARGEDLIGVATAALGPYGVRTQANLENLRG